METVDQVARGLAPEVLGVLVRRGADRAAAEDAVQEPLAGPSTTGTKANRTIPRAWLVTVAWRKFVDAHRSETARRNREDTDVRRTCTRSGPSSRTTRCSCCSGAATRHSPASAVALTLRAVGGLTTRQIAAAYLVPEATMAQRISRAKRTIGEQRWASRGTCQRPEVLYLMFNEGYTGEVDLAAEAIRLTRMLAKASAEPEVAGLLALMLLHHARRAPAGTSTARSCRWPSRTAPAGTPR